MLFFDLPEGKVIDSPIYRADQAGAHVLVHFIQYDIYDHPPVGLKLYGIAQKDFYQDKNSSLIRGWSKHTAVINELMIPGVIPEPTLCMILVSCILDPITAIHDPGAYYPHSWLFVPPRAKWAPYAHGYTLQTPNRKEADASLWNPSWADAAGQLVSNFDDLAVWTKVLGTGELLSKESFKEMTDWHTVPNTKSKLKYGITLGNFDGMLFHTGELPGYNTLVAYSSREHFAIVISTNTDTAIKSKDVLWTR